MLDKLNLPVGRPITLYRAHQTMRKVLGEQGTYGMNENYDTCMYRNSVGNVCAVGTLIPSNIPVWEDQFESDHEGIKHTDPLINEEMSVWRIVDVLYPGTDDTTITFLLSAQHLHDGMATGNKPFEELLPHLAELYRIYRWGDGDTKKTALDYINRTVFNVG